MKEAVIGSSGPNTFLADWSLLAQNFRAAIRESRPDVSYQKCSHSTVETPTRKKATSDREKAPQTPGSPTPARGRTAEIVEIPDDEDDLPKSGLQSKSSKKRVAESTPKSSSKKSKMDILTQSSGFGTGTYQVQVVVVSNLTNCSHWQKVQLSEHPKAHCEVRYEWNPGSHQ